MLSEEQQMLIDSVSTIANAEFQEKAFTWEGDTPWENIELLAEQGYLGINISEEFGGSGMSNYEAMLLIEAIGRICPDTAQYLFSQQLIAGSAIESSATDKAKEKYLPGIVSGDTTVAIAISEPEAGSDLAAIETQVKKEKGEFILNGQKIWVSDLSRSDAAIVWAKFPDGLGSVIIDLDNPGIEIGNEFTNMSGNDQTQFYIEDVTVPEENILTRGDRFKEQLQHLNWERLGSATYSNTIALCALEKALEYAQNRSQFGKPISDFQGIEWKLVDLYKEVELSRTFTHSVAQQAIEKDQHPSKRHSAMAKLVSAQMVEHVVSESLQIHGANGYQKGHPIEYLYREARGKRISAGTDEIQKNLIADELKSSGVSPMWGIK